MATTNAQVKEVGGLNHADDYLAFRFSNPTQLENAINNARSVAASWLRTNLVTGIYTSTDTDVQVLVALAEAYISLHFLVPALKARKVFGTDYAFDSEDSDRYEALIDVEWMDLAKQLLGSWITIPVEGAHFARPRLRVGTAIDPLSEGFETVEEELSETLDEVRGVGLVLP